MPDMSDLLALEEVVWIIIFNLTMLAEITFYLFDVVKNRVIQKNVSDNL